MSTSDFGFLANNALPSRDAIIALCKLGGADCVGVPLSNHPGEPIIAWVKYGPNIDIDEALTQDWVAKSLESSTDHTVRVPRVYDYFSMPSRYLNNGYIVMEYIDAPDCTKKDVKLIARAVQTLIGVRGPSSIPGHVGGGFVVHNFFLDEWKPPFKYNTVNELEQHINGILRVREDPRRVNLVADARDGLYLCPCDIHPGNFKKLPNGKVVALDFTASCFLPPSFFAVAMAKVWDEFAIKVAQSVDYPKSADVAAMTAASWFLIPFQRNDIGQWQLYNTPIVPLSLDRRSQISPHA
ncbi:hypothetical protein C8J57DRAFT_1041333 [Mycena rebaudengoi]|nr:hypothetical protein C8J57DRAFT_1041333 [Mycena rebaudengoi]